MEVDKRSTEMEQREASILEVVQFSLTEQEGFSERLVESTEPLITTAAEAES